MKRHIGILETSIKHSATENEEEDEDEAASSTFPKLNPIKPVARERSPLKIYRVFNLTATVAASD